MRYYDIEITDAKTGEVKLAINTKNNVGLHIELNAVVTGMSESGTATLKIFNLPIKFFTRQFDFVGKLIKIKGGMNKGLPLANPSQQGVLVFGYIQFCIGERERGVTFLMFNITPSAFTPKTPKNFVLKWEKGQKLSDALRNTFTNAGLIANQYTINLADKWVATKTDAVGFTSETQFSRFLGEASKLEMIMYFDTGSQRYIVTDGSEVKKKTKVISLRDLIGQPIWNSGSGSSISINGTVSIPVTLRGDLQWQDIIDVVDPQVTKSGQGTATISLPNSARVGFSGKFVMFQQTHIANYAIPGGDNWVTVIEATTVGA
jgi:hypothetical protein